VHQELQSHFDEEEMLLRKYGFGNPERSGASNTNSFSAADSHVKDHKRILAMVESALEKLQGVCDVSDSYGGTVPKIFADELCKAFVDHATMFDSLYEGKLFDQTAIGEVIGWYNFEWEGGSFLVCFRPFGNFFCPQYRAPAKWTMVEDVVKIDWGQFGRYVLTFDRVAKGMEGREISNDESTDSNWRRAKFLHGLDAVETAILGDGAGTEWEFEWKEGKFPIKFKADGYNTFLCDIYPANAYWSVSGTDVVINWGHLGKYKLAINPATKTMAGGQLGGDESKDTWWRKASFTRNLPVPQRWNLQTGR